MMSALMIVRTFLEILGILLAAYAVYRKDAVDAFEEKLFRTVRFYLHKYKRQKNRRKMQESRTLILAVDNTDKEFASCPEPNAVNPRAVS